MTNIATNIVTHFPSKTLGTLFKNPNNNSDPNIYVLFSGHVCRSDRVNTTFLTFQNKTVNAKVLNVNVWIDVACAVIQKTDEIDFPIITTFLPEPQLGVNQSVTYFSNYQINNSLVRPITSNIRVPDYLFPQEIYYFLYPESFLLKENQGVLGFSGSPVIDSNNNIIGFVSKIVGCLFIPESSHNLIGTKMNMIYYYLFDEKYGLIPLFLKYYLNNPNIKDNLNILNGFRNNFNIIICHTGFLLRSYKFLTCQLNRNLTGKVDGLILDYRVTGINQKTYSLVNYLQKNDPEITYFRMLFDGTSILSDFYINKAWILIRTLTFVHRNGKTITLDLGTQSIANYYINGEPSQPITIEYLIYAPSGINGINKSFGPVKTITINPIIVDDGPGRNRYSSQLPVFFTSTTSRVNRKIRVNLYNLYFGYKAYNFKYSALRIKNQIAGTVDYNLITQVFTNNPTNVDTTPLTISGLASPSNSNFDAIQKYNKQVTETNTVVTDINYAAMAYQAGKWAYSKYKAWKAKQEAKNTEGETELQEMEENEEGGEADGAGETTSIEEETAKLKAKEGQSSDFDTADFDEEAIEMQDLEANLGETTGEVEGAVVDADAV